MTAPQPRAAPTAGVEPSGERPALAADRAGRFYCPELDGLRFFAFLAVYVNHTFLFGAGGHHGRLPPALGDFLGAVGIAGAFGVDLFFALSAYLITELLLRERAVRGSLDVRAFYVRRILRIWPLYFTFLFIARALAYFVPGEQLTWGELAGFALFSGNWVSIFRPVVTVAAPLWSVSVEEQFYLLWPTIVRRGSMRRLVVAALTIVLAGVAIRFALSLHGVNEPWVSKNSLTRVDGIAAGVLLAVALRGRMPRMGPWARAALLSGGLLTLFVVARWFRLFGGPVSVPFVTFGWPLVAAGCAAVLLSVLGDARGIGAFLRTRPLVYLGRISYGLYVFHQIGLLVGGRLFPRFLSSTTHWAGHFVVGLAVTIALAAASYRWIEQPFLRLKSRRFTVVRSRPDDEAVPRHAAE